MVSVEAYERSLAERVRLNRQILENPYWFLPVDDKGHENYEPVGRGAKSSDLCGCWVSYDVCKDVEAHKGKVVDGVDYTDSIAVRHKHWFCNRSGCSVCFIRGWSVRKARFIVGRLDKAVERGFGKIEHVVVSVRKEDYGLSEKALREKCRSALLVRGVDAGTMLFHGFRIDRGRRVLVWSPHYHILGFILGGYEKCRCCERKWNCLKGCGGFDDRSYQHFLKDGYYVKVLKERKTIFGSAFYHLNHATVRVSAFKRSPVITWFGRCGYNNFKGGKVEVKAESPCFVCGGEMTKHFYVGKRRFAKDIGDVDYKPRFAVHVSESDDFVEVIGRSGGFG